MYFVRHKFHNVMPVFLIKLNIILLSLTFLLIVYADGSICLDILQNRWSPTYDVSAILTSIQVIFAIQFFTANIIILFYTIILSIFTLLRISNIF